MKYLRKFDSHTDYAAVESGLTHPNVSLCRQEDEVHYNPKTWADEYLTFVALESGTFAFQPRNNNVISYSTDNGTTWTEGNSVEVVNGDKVMWKGEFTTGINGSGKFSSTANFDIQGNIMSLLYGDNFKGQINLTGKDYAFYNLFRQNEKVVNAKNLSLPAMVLAERCYYGMFDGCISLITTPKLSATTLAILCYYQMFKGCTSLTTAPELPVTTLTERCYQYMFSGCTSLTTPPQLPATTIPASGYSAMFANCTNLTTAPELPATTVGNYAYRQMFQNCYKLKKVMSELPATTIGSTSYFGMFNRCIGLQETPKISATTLGTSGCTYMFANCSGITESPELKPQTLPNYGYYGMFSGCTSLNSITCLATDVSASNCLTNWVSGVAASGTFTKAASMENWTTGINGIPNGWTVNDYQT